MPETCSACGSEISEQQLQARAAVRHGTKVYCADCAKLILPMEKPASRRLTLIAPLLSTPLKDDTLTPAAHSAPAVAEPAAKPPAEAAPAPRRRRSPIEKPLPEFAGSSTAEAVSAETETGENVIRPPSRSWFIRPKAWSQRTATKNLAANGSSTSKRKEAAERRAQSRTKQNTSAGIIIGVLGVACVLLLIVVLSSSSSSNSAPQTAAPADANPVYDDNTPADVYASRAAAELAKGNKRAAHDFYVKASEAAERRGNSAAAQRYNMQAVSIGKSFTIQDN